MFVPASAPVGEHDLVVTADVDSFVMMPEILDELLQPQNRNKISLLQV